MNTIAETYPVNGPAVAVANVAPVGNSAVSWGAILAGAAAAAALSLILLILGTGLGLSSMSPWVHEGMSAKSLGITTILWVTITQVLASGMGGYIAGRLRTKWIAVHTDEVHFRDTAHGFLAWCVASLATAALLTSVIGSIVSGGIQAGAAIASGAATVALASASGESDSATSGGNTGSAGYFIDSLFRRDPNAPASAAGLDPNAAPFATTPDRAVAADAPTAEVARIFLHAIAAENLPAEDARYLGQIVAERTGLSQPDAEKRVNDTYARMQATLREAETAAKEATDKARKASAYAALWLFISLLIGAFVASLTATFGGRQRDL